MKPLTTTPKDKWTLRIKPFDKGRKLSIELTARQIGAVQPMLVKPAMQLQLSAR